MIHKECLLKPIIVLLFCVFSWLSSGLIQAAATPNFQVISSLTLGGLGGWDYMTVDSLARRMYISRGTHVMVLDCDTLKQVGDIPDTLGVHGIAIAHNFGRGYTSNGKADTVTAFDLFSRKVIQEIKVGKNPDCIVFDPFSLKIFTFNGKSKDASAINIGVDNSVETIPLGGKPEFAAADGAGKIYVNIEDTNEVVEVDTNSLAVTRRFSIKPGEEPTGLAIDTQNHLVFSVCGNKLMTVLDTNTGSIVATLPIGAKADAAVYDPERRLIFSSNGDGTLTIIKEITSDSFEVVQTVSTQFGARTMGLDLSTHQLYLPSALFETAPESTSNSAEKQRPKTIKDSFMLVTVGDSN